MGDGLDEFAGMVGTAPRPKRGGITTGWDATAPAPPQPPVNPGNDPSDGFRRWAASDTRFWGAKQTHDQLPAGLYRCKAAPDIGYYLDRQTIETDNLVDLPDSDSEQIVREIRHFWELKPEFVARGFLHKRGVLLWGPPGSGKTTTVQQLIQVIVGEHDGVGVFIDEPGTSVNCLQMLRKIEAKRPIIALLEDFDALVERHGETEFLALLDGETQIDNVVFVATTNYPERLDRRFVDRPSRFDTIRKIGMPTGPAREAYLKAKEPSLVGGDLDLWVRKTDGFSIAHLRELIILCRCFGRPLHEAIERLEAMRESKPNSADGIDRPRVGFAA